jgi:putative DNA methylase
LKTEYAPQSKIREYERSSSIVFLKTKEAFGGLSNMAGGFPLRVNGIRILTSEALYQACRFPHRPEVQRLVIEQNSPMTAKMKTKPYRDDTRPDWDGVRVKIMRWCLRVKLAQNYSIFARLLQSTGERPIVEESRKDDFWGAKPLDVDVLVGMNVLGRLLMELRQDVYEKPEQLLDVLPLDIPDFLLFSQPIEAIQGRSSAIVRTAERPPAPQAHPRSPLAASTDRATDKMVNTVRKKLIEVSIPLEAINVASAREKSIRHGHPSTLHLWWARRPLAACRAVLFAQLVDDPSSWPERFDNDETKIEAERKRLHKIIADMVPWEASSNETILNAARWEIARSVAWGLGEEPPQKDDSKALLNFLQTKAPPVYDPFSGGGSIPLEAQRLGLRAYGSDLNPVAVLIGKALVEIPPKFADRPPLNPKAREEAKNGALRAWRGTQGLAEDVRHYGQWMREEAEKRIGHLYPKAKLPDGSEATVIAWLWARTVRSPDPAAKGAMVPLVSSFMLSTKEGKKAWVEPVVDPVAPNGYYFVVREGKLSKENEQRFELGTKSAKGEAFLCVVTGSPIERKYIQAEGKSDRLGTRLMAVVVEKDRSRIYLAPDPSHEHAASTLIDDRIVEDARASFLSAATPTRAMITGGVCSAYGLRSWGHLFTSRQIVALSTYAELVIEAREKVKHDAGLIGAESQLYADAIATYLGLGVGRLTDIQNSLCRWETSKTQVRNLFSRQGMAMVWDFAENNIFNGAAGDFATSLENLTKAMKSAPAVGIGQIDQLDAAKNNYPVRPIVISTDPPYYDNIAYSILSDFFYVWLRKALSEVWPDLFRRLTTPKEGELVATSFQHGGKAEAEAFFMKGMGQALTAIGKAATDNEPLAIYYAFKQSELAKEGVVSAGWASFLQAVVDAGLGVDGTWPVRTELSNRMIAKGTNALASSIVLVCRKREQSASVVTRADFVRALKREMPDAIDNIRKAGVGPVDMEQSVIGPGMGIFTRYAKVLEDDDSAMPVKTALALINRVWEEIENELDTNFDAETQVALAWFATYGFDAKPSGELITLANAKNVSLGSLFSSGVFWDGKGKGGLTVRNDLPHDWNPESDKGLTVWECVQHTARALSAEDGGGEAAARLVGQMGAKADPARALAYRLFEIATKKGWTAEALIYNELAQEWPKLEDLASATDARAASTAPAQAEMF